MTNVSDMTQSDMAFKDGAEEVKQTARERFVLIEPSHAGNVGAAARALKVMGLTDLVLVRPRDARVLGRQETIARASGAVDILKNARIVDTVAQALEGMSYVCSTAMTPRDFGPLVQMPHTAFPELARSAHTVAFLFGCERYGMSNEDVYRSHLVLSIPTNPAYGSLNLASAVQLIAYEWRQALGGFDVQPRTINPELASAQAVQGVLEHWEEALVHIDFLDPAAPKKLIPRLNQLFNRAELTNEEVQILRGIARSMLRTRLNGDSSDCGDN